jgi:cytosine/adenosine deaminase-related metal-dependent hydrolase
MKHPRCVSALAIAFSVGALLPIEGTSAADWAITGTVLGPAGIVVHGAVSISGQTIASIGPASSISVRSSSIKVPGIILPGLIDLHNHLTWNILPRWLPGRQFSNRYEWQDSAEYDRDLAAPHAVAMANVACQAQIYAEIKALAGGATAVVGSLLPNVDHPEYTACAVGLTRTLDVASGLRFTTPSRDDPCEKATGNYQPLLNVVDNEVFPLELPHVRMDFLLCELRSGGLRSLIIHLSEGGVSDSSARREFMMFERSNLLTPGLVIIHGTALREEDFKAMHDHQVGLVWSPRSNDELYGSTTNIAAARRSSVPVAIAPDWSPSGSAGMLQEIGYVARRYPILTSDELIMMATATAAKVARLDDQIGSLEPGKQADLLVISVEIDGASRTPLNPVVTASPADVALVVVGGQPLYGDPAILAQLLPAGSQLEPMKVCGAQKAVYLGQSGAAARGWRLRDVIDSLNAALAKAGSSLPDIECD